MSWSSGPKLDLPGLSGRGTVSDPVPVTGLALNFSPMPRMAPPPLGSAMDGGAEADLLDAAFDVPLDAGTFDGAVPSGALAGEALWLSRSEGNGHYLNLGGGC